MLSDLQKRLLLGIRPFYVKAIQWDPVKKPWHYDLVSNGFFSNPPSDVRDQVLSNYFSIYYYLLNNLKKGRLWINISMEFGWVNLHYHFDTRPEKPVAGYEVSKYISENQVKVFKKKDLDVGIALFNAQQIADRLGVALYDVKYVEIPSSLQKFFGNNAKSEISSKFDLLKYPVLAIAFLVLIYFAFHPSNNKS